MRIRSPSLPELHAFAAVARSGSFGRAAQALCVTQGAVSRAVARLEAHLGQPLVQRQGRGSVLTPAGRAYFEVIAPALAQLESAAEVFGLPGRWALRVSVTPSLFSKWLIPRLPDFRARHPAVALEFVPYRREAPFDPAEADAWIRSGGERWPGGIAADYLLGRELVPICRPQDLLGADAPREPRDLLGRPLLFHSHYPGNWADWFCGCGLHDVTLRPAAQFDQVSMLVEAVIAGLGLAVVQRCLIEDDLREGRIALALDQPVRIERGYHLCYAVQGRERPALVAWREWLLEQCRRGSHPVAADTAPKFS